MIEQLTISGYRAFEKLQVDGLSQINLIVGRNNAGKTALLDAVDLYLQRNAEDALYRASDRRGEGRHADVDPDGQSPWQEGYVDLRLLVHGREVSPGVSFSVEEAGRGAVRYGVVAESGASARSRELTLICEVRSDVDEGEPKRSSITIEGTRVGWSLHRFRDPSGVSWMARGTTPVRFVRAIADPISQLATDWNSIALTDLEDAVIDALRVIEPGIRRIAYLGGAGPSIDPDGFVVTLGATRTRVPLGSLGDGVRRILAIIVNAVSASNGALLVDEIDTGLHHTAMLGMWRSLLTLAHAQKVQVFATTHSLDCVYALGQLVAAGDEAAASVSLHRIEVGEPRTVRYTGAEIAAVARSGMEVR